MNPEFRLESPAFPPEGTIPPRHASRGENLSPPLFWANLPPGTKDLALVVDDQDTEFGEPRVHWVLYNLSPTFSSLDEGIPDDERPPVPPGISQGINGWETFGYRGPEPEEGQKPHHYVFTLFALDAPLLLVPGLTKRSLQRAMFGHVLGRAELSGRYS